MAEAKDEFELIREWVVDHKLRTVGNLSLSSCIYWEFGFDFDDFGLIFFFEECLWLNGIAGSIAYNWSQPNMKTSVEIIHAR